MKVCSNEYTLFDRRRVTIAALDFGLYGINFFCDVLLTS